MEDYFELFRKVLKNERSGESSNKNLQLIENTLNSEVEFLKKSIGKYQANIKDLIKNDEFGLTESLIKLKENNKILQCKNEELQNKFDEICKQSTYERENLQQHYDHQIETIKFEHQEKIKSLEQRNQELLTELHMIQATSAVELDETEKNLKQQLYEINQRLRDELNSSQTLRNDLRLLKEEYEQYKSWNNKKIMDLRRQLEYTQEQNKLIQVKNNLQNQTVEVQIDDANLNPTEISNNNNDNVIEKPQFKRPTPLYRGSRKSTKTKVPPLISCSEPKTDNVKKPGRKRKLFNPNDFTHLETP